MMPTDAELIKRSLSLEYDSEEWRQIRNQLLNAWIQDDKAVSWFLDFSDVCEFFDDAADRDVDYDLSDVVRALSEALIYMPMNPFFQSYCQQLIPIVKIGIENWFEATRLERQKGVEKEKRENQLMLAYFKRDVYCVEMLKAVIEITRGTEIMREISPMIEDLFFHESLESYKKQHRDKNS